MTGSTFTGAAYGLRGALQEDFGRCYGVATRVDEVDADVQVGAAGRELLGERERIPGLDEDVQAPAFDLGLLAAIGVLNGCLGDLGHLAAGIRDPFDDPFRFLLAPAQKLYERGRAAPAASASTRLTSSSRPSISTARS